MGADPQPIGSAIEHAMRARGWRRQLDTAKVLGRWEAVAGEAVAAHCRPVSLEEDGTLVVLADSAVWATQLTFLRGTVLDRVARECGPGLVRALRVRTDEAGGRRRSRFGQGTGQNP